jgi:hypothetical protein
VGSYYYLAAQLPYLIYGQAAPMTPQAFKELAVPFLSARDAKLLNMVSLDPQPPAETGDAVSYAKAAKPSGSNFIDQWREWERVFRLNLAKHRSIKLGREGEITGEPPQFPMDAVSLAVKAVASTESPLEVEIFIDKGRWNAIETLQGNVYFSTNTILAYMLKLLLLERRASFQVEKGFSEYKSLYASILENVQSGAVAAGESK